MMAVAEHDLNSEHDLVRKPNKIMKRISCGDDASLYHVVTVGRYAEFRRLTISDHYHFQFVKGRRNYTRLMYLKVPLDSTE